MKKKKVTQTDTAAELRRLAEERLAASGKTASHAEAEEESLRIVHELRVHQFELEMQNEELRKARDQKEAALERYTDLYEFAPVSYFTLDRAGIIRNVNLTGASLIGIDRSHLNGRLFRFFVAHKARPTFADFLDKFFASPVKVTCELELLAEENSPRFVQIEAMADASGEECRIALIDITERKLAEDALGASEEKYRAIFECSRDAIMTLEPPFLMFTTGNPSTVKMFGALNEKEFISLGPWGLSPDRQPDGRASVEKPKEMIETAMREDTHFFEWTHKRISGEEFPADVLLNRMELKGKAILQATVRDITERKLTEAALKDREEKHRKVSQEFNALLDKLPDGIVQIAPDFRIVWANRPVAEMVKYDEDQLKGKYCFQGFWSKGEICGSCPAARSFQSGEFEEGNITTPDGRLLELRAVPISDESGKVESVIQVIRDITDHKKLEQQFRQAQKMEAIGTLAGGIAHDFNNILTAIVGYGYIAQLKMGPDDPQREDIQHMLEGADRAAHLTKDLLIFSRKQVSEKSPVNLNEIVGIVEKFLVRIIGEDIVCSTSLHGEPIVVFADTHQLEQVLMNLATNARDAMPEGGNLMIATEQVSLGDDYVASQGYGKSGRYALLSISDTGAGMDEATLKNIFEPFFTTKEVGKGTGLGLAVVYGIIKEHDGYINVYSEPGIGTTFKIYLPLITSEVREVEIAPVEKLLTKGTETILLAEDDESVRGLITIVLKQEGYTVIEAADGEDAMKKFMENRETINLLVTDLIMPRMNGKEAYDEMKVWRPGLKAIFASGYAPDAIRQKMSLDRGVELISKPITPFALLKKERSLLDEEEE